METVNNEGFFFIRHPRYVSFALIQVLGELPVKIPRELYLLMPGNQSGKHEGVVVEQDQKYLEEQVKVGCPEWFEVLQDKKWGDLKNLKYRLVGRYLFM